MSDLKVKKNIQSENFYFELESSFRKQLFKDSLSIAKTVRNLSKEININYFNLWDAKTRTVISLSMLRRLSKFLIKNGFKQYAERSIEKHIIYIKNGFSQEKVFIKFPINLRTIEGMRFVSHLYHDGGSGKDNRQPNYTNQQISEVKEFLSDAQRLFGKFHRKIVYYTNPHSKEAYYRVNLPTVIGDIMVSVGYKAGDKTKQNPNTFKFLENIDNKELVSEFLSKAFNDDGSVGKRQINLGQASLINLKIKPSKVLLLDKLFLEKLNIKVNGPRLMGIYNNRHGKVSKFNISISSKEQISKFYENIKLIEYKQRKIEAYLLNWGLRNHKRNKYILSQSFCSARI